MREEKAREGVLRKYHLGSGQRKGSCKIEQEASRMQQNVVLLTRREERLQNNPVGCVSRCPYTRSDDAVETS